jgi:hypothetical protein
MESLFENKPLFMILNGLGAACMICATGWVPYLNYQLELIVIEDAGFRSLLMVMLLANIGAVTLFEQLCFRLFPSEEKNEK